MEQQSKYNKFITFVLILLVVGLVASNLYFYREIQSLQAFNQSLTTTDDSTATTVANVQYDVTTTTTEVVDSVENSVVGVANYVRNQLYSTGSGVVYQIDGDTTYIITNNHVITDGTSFEVVFADGNTYDATLVGGDTYSDIAVLAVKGVSDPKAMKLGSTSLLDSGETVVAIGSPLGLEYSGTVTQGVISGKDRTITLDLNDDGVEDWDMNVIQTDAAINPGNSGGALVNMAGELVGITSSKLAATDVEGMGFAIPVEDATTYADQIIENGEVSRPVLGISSVSLENYSSYQRSFYGISSDLDSGIYIAKVYEDSAASAAGLEEGDVIVSFDGQEVTTYKSFLTLLYSKQPGDKVAIVINRSGKDVTVNVTLK